MIPEFDPLSGFVIVGLLHLFTPLITWGVLVNKRSASTVYWCLGGFLAGIGSIWIAMAMKNMPWMVWQALGNILLLGGIMMKMRSLRIILNFKHPKGAISGFFVVFFLLQALFLQFLGEGVVQVLNIVVHALMYFYIGILAWKLYVVQRIKSSLWIAFSYFLVVFALTMSVITIKPDVGQIWVHGYAGIILPLVGALIAFTNHIGYIGVLLETSQQEEIKAQAEIRHQQERQRLSQSLVVSQRERVLANMSRFLTHELSQPLAVIVSTAKLLRRSFLDGRLNEVDMSSLVQRLDTAADVASGIVSRIRPATKAQIQTDERLNLTEVIKQALDLMNLQPATVHVSLLGDWSTKEYVLGNRVELLQVFINLLTNAVQAGKSMRATVQISVRLENQGANVCCEIRDNGPGFSEAALAGLGEEIFSTKTDGMGVGLWLSQEIINRHAGQLSYGNHEHGASVMLHLPLVT